jgi:hypothetical protein
MGRNKFTSVLFVFSIFYSISMAADYRTGIDLGYYGGRGGDLYVSTHHFARGFPLAVKLNSGYSIFNPGNANDARRIFINNNTGGTIEKKGSVTRLSLDFLYPIQFMNLPETYVYFGPRYIGFKGNFRFIGDNEDFDVTSTHWGVGIGLESNFPISKRINFVVLAGFDYYGSSTLYGHDTSYSPNGEDSNPRENYNYSDADNAINQPGIEPRLMLGFSYLFGK